ncbi:MAG: hypothetical protein IPM26_01915 [Saprospiraceae bacterium]|nr:hypothetical protein [Saprospiraceae bacterium]
MSYIPTLYKEEENKRKGLIISVLVHLALLIFLIVPFLNPMQKWPPEEGGILVVFGDENAGNDSNPAEATTDNSTAKETKAAATPESIPVNTAPSKVKEEESAVIAGKNKTEAQKKAEAEAKAKAEKDKAEREKAEAEAKKKAEAEQSKKQFSDLFGSGRGNSGTSGNQGDPKGDPDGKVLEGISTGSGQIGGGLSGRGVLFEPAFRDNSQKTGRVVLNICVDSEGKVISATFTQKGSTTSDAYLIDIARSNAMKYKFSKSEIDKQCGSLTIDFRLR